MSVNKDYSEIWQSLKQERIKTLDKTKCWRGCGSVGTHIWFVKVWQILLWYYHINWKLSIPYDLTAPLLGIYTWEALPHVHQEICVGVFTAALLIIVISLN